MKFNKAKPNTSRRIQGNRIGQPPTVRGVLTQVGSGVIGFIGQKFIEERILKTTTLNPQKANLLLFTSGIGSVILATVMPSERASTFISGIGIGFITRSTIQFLGLS